MDAAGYPVCLPFVSSLVLVCVRVWIAALGSLVLDFGEVVQARNVIFLKTLSKTKFRLFELALQATAQNIIPRSIGAAKAAKVFGETGGYGGGVVNDGVEQPESSNDIYLTEQGDTNITIDSLDICYDRAQDDQDETDDSKNRNKFLESSNKELVDKLKGEIEDFKTKNKSLESSNNHFKEANNELSMTNQLMFKDLKKFQAELDKYDDVNYASKVEIDYAKAKGDL
ncbi:hypothetical protein Tco_0719424, partial [Tanacetum coccineum]